jgi:hypothetical protein
MKGAQSQHTGFAHRFIELLAVFFQTSSFIDHLYAFPCLPYYRSSLVKGSIMPTRESRGSLLAMRERYLWLWRQLQKLEQKLKIHTGPVPSLERRELWAQRMKKQLMRYWP